MALVESTQPSYIELTPQQEEHLARQIYYFTAFIRSVYQLLLQKKEGAPVPLSYTLLDHIKQLALYYAKTYLNGDFQLVREQRLIDELNNSIGISPQDLRTLLLSVSENMFNKSDGCVADFVFGSLPAADIHGANIPFADEKMDAANGIMRLNQKRRNELVSGLCTYITQERLGMPVDIFGNVARGVLDGAFLTIGLQKQNVPVVFHLYRASSQAMRDRVAHVLNEEGSGGWGIAADSMTARGYSVPLSVEMLHQMPFQRRSVYITYCAELWYGTLPVEYVYRSDSGVILQANLDAIKRELPRR